MPQPPDPPPRKARKESFHSPGGPEKRQPLTAHYARRPKPEPLGICTPLPGSSYTLEQVQFIRAVATYRQRNQRPAVLHVTEYLAVLLSLGYKQVAAPGPLPHSPKPDPPAA
jgi:hypothetical protein